MKHIPKSLPEPPELTAYRKRHAKAPAMLTWVHFKKNNARRDAVREQLRRDQRGLCAYCEISLVLQDESVEHFNPRWADTLNELDWDNLLLCCCGGEKPLPEDVEDAAFRYDPSSEPTCGRAKWGEVSPILNPLRIPPFPRLLRFSYGTGEVFPDDEQCRTCGIDPADAERTIRTLGLRSKRLNLARMAVIEVLLELLDDEGSVNAFSHQLEQDLASQQIPATGLLPAFFTTIRWVLGEGAESYLKVIRFDG